ncbi:MAG: primase-helicase zinc-binding domain-containing protein [Bacteriovoracia bacterium]
MELQYGQTKNQNQIKKPSDIFKHCPHCKSRDQFRFDGEVFCNSCGWNSVLVSAECSYGVASRMRKPLPS